MRGAARRTRIRTSQVTAECAAAKPRAGGRPLARTADGRAGPHRACARNAQVPTMHGSRRMRQFPSRSCTMPRLLVSRLPSRLDRVIRSTPYACPPGLHALLALRGDPHQVATCKNLQDIRPGPRKMDPIAPPELDSAAIDTPRSGRHLECCRGGRAGASARRPACGIIEIESSPKRDRAIRAVRLGQTQGFASPERTVQPPRKALLWPAPRRKA